MSNDLNRCEFIGRLGRDPETRYSPSGTAVVNMSIAVGKKWTDKDSGEKKESVTWVPLVAFGKLGEICNEYLKKGMQIYAAGEFRVRKWQDKEGKDRWSTEVILDQMQMLGSKGDGAGQARAENQANAYAQAKGNAGGQRAPEPSAPAAGAADFDDDIPFDVYERGSVV